jgi:hypothetical protein
MTRRHDVPEFNVAMSVEPSAASAVAPDIASTSGGSLVEPTDIDGMTVILEGVRDPSENVPRRVTHGAAFPDPVQC